MKTKKYYLILAVVAAILCAPAWARVELHPPDEQGLIDHPNPALVGIERLEVAVVPPDAEPNKDGLVWGELRQKILHELRKAHIPSCILINGKYSLFSCYAPDLRVCIDMLKLPDSPTYVFHIQTFFSNKVRLSKGPSLFIEADVWKVAQPMQVVSVKNMPAVVTEVVLEQVDAFIAAYLAANPPGTRPSAPNDITVRPEKLTKPDEKRIAAEYKYVASKNSKVFHKPECRWAKRIKPANLVGYNSRNEAIEAGKRPCKLCKP